MDFKSAVRVGTLQRPSGRVPGSQASPSALEKGAVVAKVARLILMNRFIPGQRWMSEAEPELGLGTVLKLAGATVTVGFASAGQTRTYASDNAPLRRVRFQAGETITSAAGASGVVRSVSERDGLLTYHGDGAALPEGELADALAFASPEQRLCNGQADPNDAFELRCDALRHLHRIRQSPLRGFVGGRISLIPHQLFVAQEVTARRRPRVLLADEVGLGKTIEACLILHRLLQTGRAERALVLVPESLVHQWFVELLRRFNLYFKIFDEERCVAITTSEAEANPFLDDQLILCSVNWLAANERRGRQAVAAGWDLLIVDEAHHLGWTPTSASAEYRLVESLARDTGGVLLLTATPEQLGQAGHFARLRLLDPDRYADFAAFQAEAEHFRVVAEVANELLAGKTPGRAKLAALLRVFANEPEGFRRRLESLATADAAARQAVIADLVDRHGTGRVMFRNTRAAIAGFPRRLPQLARLAAAAKATDAEELLENLAREFAADDPSASGDEPDFDFENDPRIEWLAALLRELGEAKVLLICRTRAKVDAIEDALRGKINVKAAVFHEDLPLIQRDRNAAWFADEDGARILLCSEIGGEGRNFQFAHHLVLFDLPLDPEVLEQRIGRLDRIGQGSDIRIHVPFVPGGAQEVLARWFHEGLGAFERCLHGGSEVRERFAQRVRGLAMDFHETRDEAGLAALIAETREFVAELTARLATGRDRLLELNSFNPAVAQKLVKEIAAVDADESLEGFLIRVFDDRSIRAEAVTGRTFLLGGGDLVVEHFPGLPEAGLLVSCERATALSREHFGFLTWDHPMVGGAMDAILGADRGNAAFALWEDAKSRSLYVEAVFVLECLAPARLHADRFLPATPVRIVVDAQLQACPAVLATVRPRAPLRDLAPHALLARPELTRTLLPKMLARATALAEEAVPALVQRAVAAMEAELDHEVERLVALQAVNRHVRPEEIALATEERAALGKHLRAARLRLDAVRIVWRGAAEFFED